MGPVAERASWMEVGAGAGLGPGLGCPCPHAGPPSADKDVGSCPQSQIFRYNLTTCQQTCRSLSEADAHCLEGFAPVDGCGCPDQTFLDEKGRCVPLAKCSCYHRGLYLEAGEVVLRQEERWWVAGTSGRGATPLRGAHIPPPAPQPPGPAPEGPLTPPSLTASAGPGGCTVYRSSCWARVSSHFPVPPAPQPAPTPSACPSPHLS